MLWLGGVLMLIYRNYWKIFPYLFLQMDQFILSSVFESFRSVFFFCLKQNISVTVFTPPPLFLRWFVVTIIHWFFLSSFLIVVVFIMFHPLTFCSCLKFQDKVLFLLYIDSFELIIPPTHTLTFFYCFLLCFHPCIF